MHSATDPADLTARARIRDAATTLFAARGFHRVSVRAIASAAGVSPGLVTHHFGSKEGLRRVCEEHVVSGLFDDHFEQDSSGSLVRSLTERVGAASAKIGYIARMLVEPGTTGDELFNRLVAGTARRLGAGQEAGMIRSGCDTHVTALIVTAYELARLMLRERFGSALGADPFSPEGVGRLTIPTLELLTYGLYVDDTMLASTCEELARQENSRVTPWETH
jgi:TetR/AcrR family transcriptional regulator, regulator of cefoperazone and chloramphenicol sensitivity